MRARYPDHVGIAEHDGVRVAYQVYGAGPVTVVLAPIDPMVPARGWKLQVPYLARHARVVTLDSPGSGGSDRPTTPEAYELRAMVDDILAVMDVAGVDRAVLVGLCTVVPSLWIAAHEPERVAGVVAIGGFLPGLAPKPAERDLPWDQPLDTDDGWAKENKHYWQRDYPGYVRFFAEQVLPEPHSTRQVEEFTAWALDSGGAVQTACWTADDGVDGPTLVQLLEQVRCPVLAIHGDQDRIEPVAMSEELVRITGGRLVVLAGAGHLPTTRHPVVVNHLLKDFVDQVAAAAPVDARARVADPA